MLLFEEEAAEVDVSLFELIEVSATLRLPPAPFASEAVPFSLGPLDLALDLAFEAAADAPPLLVLRSLFPSTAFDLDAADDATPDAR